MMRYSVILLIVTMYFGGFGQTVDRQTSYTPGVQQIVVTVEDTIELSGTLEYNGTEVLVIIIAGSGPTDRDCNSSIGLKTDAFKMLANHFSTIGVSSYRFDKRGIGLSTKVPESTMSLDDFVGDVRAIINHFKPNFDRVILLGHSEGALIGTIAAQANASIDLLISVSGTSIPMDEIIMEQLAKYPKLVPLAQKHIDEVKSGSVLSEVHPILQSLFRPSVVPYLKSIFDVDPMDEVSKVAQHILIINGECDLQVPPDHARQLHQANGHAQLALIPHMGHVLKALDEDCKNAVQAYNDPALPLHPDLLQVIDEFIGK